MNQCLTFPSVTLLQARLGRRLGRRCSGAWTRLLARAAAELLVRAMGVGSYEQHAAARTISGRLLVIVHAVARTRIDGLLTGLV